MPLTVVSPFSGQELAQVELASAQQIEQSLTTAYALYRNRKQWLSVVERRQILTRTATIMTERSQELAKLAASEGGKPWKDTLVEVNRAIQGVHMAAEHIASHQGEAVPLLDANPQASRIAVTTREPIGVVVAVSAFNHPLNLIVHQVGAAVAAGCPVIVKPAELTPLSCYKFAEILHEAGLPADWCQVVMPETLDLATALVTDQRVGFFSFIGSAKVGWMLRSKLAPGTRCALEHGGVAPVIADATANVDKLVADVCQGGYYHAGQVCVSVQRLFVHEEILAEVTSKLTQAASQLKVGDPLSEQTQVGPIIRQQEVERIDSWVRQAISEGAELATGGKVLDNNCYQPTLLVNPPNNCDVSQKEIFGPVVCLYSYSEEQRTQVIDTANALPFAFQASVYAQDIDRAIAIYHQLDASAVMVNDHTAFRQDAMPFAGLRESGLGVGGIPYTIDDMQIDKMLMIKSQKY